MTENITEKAARRGQSPAVFACKSKKPAKASILPFFIPMEGCPNACIFCEQRQISSHNSSPTVEEIEKSIEELQTHHELAFYGGSFTMLKKERQLYYLKAAAKGIKEGKISGIRISTRPDSIDEEKLDMLWQNGVRTIELGIQSLDKEVLHTAGRFYNRETVFSSARLIKSKGFRLGLQLMPGLPKASYESDIDSALQSLCLQPDLIRIYPTLVLEHTKLADMFRQGIYKPLTLDEAIACCRDITAIFLANNIPVIRMGLHNTQSLQDGLLAGPFDEAFGAFVYSALAAEHIKLIKEKTGCKGLEANKGYMPLLFGHKGRNRALIAELLPNGLHENKALEGKSLSAGEYILSEQEFLKQYIDKIKGK